MSATTQLVVARAFETYERGDVITDASTATAVVDGPYRDHVRRLALPTVPTAAETAVSEAEAKIAADEAELKSAEAAAH